MSECSVDPDGDVCFRGRKWAPEDVSIWSIVLRIHISGCLGTTQRLGVEIALSLHDPDAVGEIR